MRRFTFITAICLSAVLSAGLAGAASSNSNLQELMQDLSRTMLRMLPAAYDENPDKVLLLENLVRLEYLLSETEPHFEKLNQSSLVPLTLLEERLEDAKAWGLRGNKTMFQSAISEAFTLCATCHVQDRVDRRAFPSKQVDALDDYLAMEYHYLTREYSGAMASMKRYFEEADRTQLQDSIVLQRILTIGVEVKRDLPFTVMQLTAAFKYLEPEDHNFDRVSQWIEVLERLGSTERTLQNPIGKGVDALDQFLRGEWSDIRSLMTYSEQEAYWVVIRGELNRLLQSPEAAAALPQIYYWMAVVDRELQYRFYGSLSRAYLERCIAEFPHHPYAEQCLQEYELLVLISFSGSSGTHVPPEVNARLQAMRQKIAQHHRER